MCQFDVFFRFFHMNAFCTLKVENRKEWDYDLHNLSAIAQYVKVFLYFCMKSFLIARSYRVIVRNVKILNIGTLVSMEMRFKVPILAVF